MKFLLAQAQRAAQASRSNFPSPTRPVVFSQRTRAGLTALAATALLSACGGGSDGGGVFEITACAPLGCSTPGGVQVACGVTDIAVNQELRITFSRPVDLSSVNSSTFRVLDGLGVTPPGEFLLDQNDPSVLIYRPELTFDSSGNPVFGLTSNESYEITIPGVQNGDSGPFIRSANGSENQRRMRCTVSSSLPVLDLNPGAPVADVRVNVVTGYDADDNPSTFETGVIAGGATNVFRLSPIVFRFTDVMNPGTLVNPVTGQSDFIEIIVDGDGSTGTTNDQVPVEGSFVLNIDSQSLSTEVTFFPSLGYPSAGADPLQPRRVVINLPPTITDLGGNPIVNSGQITFVPESVVFPAVEVAESFNSQARQDAQRSGGDWSVDTGFGGRMLAPGIGGGSGQHGELFVPAGTTITLSTDNEDFTGITNTGIYDPIQQVRDPMTQAPLVVTNGLFEFSSLTIEAGGALRFEGNNPAQIFVRGDCRIQGTLDVSGSAAPDHISTACEGGEGGLPGPGGRLGGFGGERPPTSPFNATPLDGDIIFPNAPAIPCTPTIYADNNGLPGEGILIPNSLAPTGTAGGGEGGVAFPQPIGGGTLAFPVGQLDFGNQEYARQLGCKIRASGSPGAGGAYAGPGMNAQLVLPGPASDVVEEPPIAVGGDQPSLGIGEAERTLDPTLGFLRGGSGGGGGGGHLQYSTINGFGFFDCTMLGPGQTPPLRIVEFHASSGAGGGGGGGALQIQAGNRISVQGVIDATGGDGGSDISISDNFPQVGNVTPGGGGSGGAVLLQSRTVEVSASPGRIDLRGGLGGSTRTASTGGVGSPGLLRLESIPALLVSDLVSEDCSNPFLCQSLERINSSVLPDPDALAFPVGENDPYEPIIPIENVISTAEWQTADSGAGRVSGSVSCWLQPEGNFFVLDFQEDEVDGMGNITTPGWDMDLRVSVVPDSVSFRLPGFYPGGSVQELQAGLSFPPLVVRFQGARTLQPFEDPCAVPLTGPESPIFQGSVSGWVTHPSELNDFFPGDPTRRPNMFRFMVVFDTREGGATDIFLGVEEVRVSVRPD